MNAFFDFAEAAAPWMFIGIALAVYFGRSAAKENQGSQDEKPCGDYCLEGMCLGICFGVVIGIALKGSLFMWLSLGLMLGLVIGSRIEKDTEAR